MPIHLSASRSDTTNRDQYSTTGYPYVRDGNIWVTDLRGASRKQLTFDGRSSDPMVSPTGIFVAYLSIPAESLGSAPTPQNVCIVATDGAQPPRCLSTKPALHGRPAWSPDGESILYVENGALVKTDLIGESTVLASGVAQQELSLSDVAWSPDGQNIACTLIGSRGPELWLVNPQTGPKHLVMLWPDGVSSPFSFTPDGQSLTFINASDDNRLWNVTIDGREVNGPISNSRNVRSFAWSQSGAQIAFLTQDGAIWTQDLEKTAPSGNRVSTPGQTLSEIRWIGHTDSLLLTSSTGTELTVISLTSGEAVDLVPPSSSRELDRPESLLPEADLSVPYRYQGSSESGACSATNCGPTAVAMAIQWARSQIVAISDIRNYISPGTCGNTNVDQLRSALNHWEVSNTLLTGMDAVRDAINQRNNIVIVPVVMSSIRVGADYESGYSSSDSHYDRYNSYTGGHFVVAKGISSDGNWVIVHDPNVWSRNIYWYSNGAAKGQNRYYNRPGFAAAFVALGNQAIEINGGTSTPPSGNQVELYRRANYDDRFWNGGTGRHDNISPSAYSMKLPSGWSVKTWRETGFRGDPRCWTGSVNNLQDHGWQLAIRSLEVFDRNVCSTAPPPSGDKVELFRRANYEDRFWDNGTGRHDNISPSAYSMKLPSGWSIITWRENGYRGDSRCWMGSVTNLQDHGWQLAVRSVEIFNRNACPPSKPALQSPAHGATLAAGSTVVLDWSGADNATEYAAEYWGPTGHHNSGRRANTDWNIGQLPAGTYEWHVEAYNSQGWSGWTSNRTFIVLPPAPSASFDAWPISGQAPLTSRMHIVSTANITSCQWNYGDGRTGNSCQGVHDYTYANPGSYTVQLTVSGPGGTDTKTRSNYITVNSAPPTANFDASPRTGQAPLTVRMHNASQGNITSCVWNYGDGNSGNSCSEYHEHVYARAGTYSINLTVTGPGGTNNKTQNAYITVSAPPNPTDCADGEGVILYENPNHTGRCTRFTGDDSDLGNDPIGDNQASSIRIIGNYEASLYVNTGYSGGYSTFTADDPGLGNDTIGHDRASSIRVRRRDTGGTSNCDGGPGVYLYQQANYAGRCSKFTNDSPDPANWYIGNDTASALRFIGSYEAVLYENSGYQGASSTFVGDDPDLSNDAIGNGRTSSIRVRQRTSGSSNCDNGPGVYLYEHGNYGGRCSKFAADSPNPGNWYLGNDAASSLRIIGDYEAVVYEHDNYQGQSSTFTRDDPDFSDDAIRHDRTSSIRVRQLASGPTHCSDGQFLGEYFNNSGLAGSPIFRRCDNQVSFDWGAGSPDARIPGDNFSVRWTGRFWFDAGTYRFTTRSDDGVRLWINDQQLINEWRDMAVTSVARDKSLTSGAHTLRMEYYEHGGAAIAGLTWPRQQQASGDPDDGRLITYGSSLDGTVNPTGDRDDYYFDGSSGQAITIRMDKRASALDSYIELYNPDGSLLGQDDDNGGDRNSRLAIALRQNGRHKVIARGYSSSTGGYRLSLERESTADPDDNRWIAFGNTLQGTISPNNDRDWYYFSGTAGRSVSIQMRKVDGQLDAYLELYNEAGVKVAENDDGLGNRDSWIIYTLPTGGTYRILARSYNLGTSGGYNLSLASMSNANLARGKPTVASSVEAPGLEAPRATDGSTGTRWSSRYSDGEWIEVDLGQDRTFNQVVLKWEAAYGKSFGIYYRSSSMCSTCWMQAYWTNNGQGGTNTINFNPVRARYVLMYGFGRGTSWGYSLWEFEIYDNSALVLPLVPPDPGDKPAEEVEQVAPLAPNDEDKATLLIGEGDAGQEVTPLAGEAPLVPTLGIRPDVPTVFILYPNEETPLDEEILFQGIAVDSIGGEQTIAEYLWLSSIDGPLAAVDTFSLPVASLSPGRHVITFQARTEGGEWSGPVTTEIVIEEGNTHRLYLPLIQQSQ